MVGTDICMIWTADNTVFIFSKITQMTTLSCKWILKRQYIKSASWLKLQVTLHLPTMTTFGHFTTRFPCSEHVDFQKCQIIPFSEVLKLNAAQQWRNNVKYNVTISSSSWDLSLISLSAEWLCLQSFFVSFLQMFFFHLE